MEKHKRQALTLIKTLACFKIDALLRRVIVSPTCNRFYIKPADGVKVSAIYRLNTELSLALGVPSVFVNTKDTYIIVDVPHQKNVSMYLVDCLHSFEFKQQPAFTIPIGVKFSGKFYFDDLTKLPHLLIAGRTGSGKSVFIHSIINSLLQRSQCSQCSLVLIDPKMCELKTYEKKEEVLNFTHSAKEAKTILDFLIREIKNRYEILAMKNKREIENDANRIFIIIDELADLILSPEGKKIEEKLIKIAQIGRAAGVHLIVSTQRPTVKIINGLLKANLPARICFAVNNAMESRIILDSSGAEKLNNAGEMLYQNPLLPTPIMLKGLLC